MDHTIAPQDIQKDKGIYSVPYEEQVASCKDCDHKAVCRILFKAKRISDDDFGFPVDSKLLCFSCSLDKLEETFEIRKRPFNKNIEEPYIWIELRLTNDGTKFHD